MQIYDKLKVDSFLLRNLQGDIVAIYDEDCNKLVSYTYDAWGNFTRTYTNGGQNTAAANNPFTYRGYYYDYDLKFYYLNSRYYDPYIGRFINADDAVFIGADGTLLSYNIFLYCKNDPINDYDPSGNLSLVASVIIAGAVVGGLLGAFSAATTGGDVLESTIEGMLTGACGSACAVLINNAWIATGVATLAGAAIDLTVQSTTQYIENGRIDSIDWGRTLKTAIQTGMGTAVPGFKNPATDVVDAVGSITIWGEASALITISDVIVTNIIEASRSHVVDPIKGTLSSMFNK